MKMVARTGRAAHNGGCAWPIGSWIVRRLARGARYRVYEQHAVHPGHQPGGHDDIGGAECRRGAGRTGMSSSVSGYHVESLRSAGGRHRARRHASGLLMSPHPLPARVGDQFA
jgi:hypothetical protein